jgi:hypothetical protein
MIFLVYFYSIGFMPELTPQASITLLATSVLTAAFLLILLTSSLFAPFVLWKILMPNHERLQILWHKGEQYAPVRAMAWVILPFVVIVIVGGIFFLSPATFERLGISIEWYLAFIAIILLLPSLVLLLFWKKLRDNPPCILRWPVTRDLFLFHFLSFGGLVISFHTLIVVFIRNSHLSSIDAITLYFLVLIWNFSMVTNTPKIPLRKHLFIALFIIFFLFLRTDKLTLIPSRIMNIYKFGNLPNASLVFDEIGCSIVQHYGMKVTLSTPDPKTATPPNPKTCSLPNVMIHSRLGNTYYLEASRAEGPPVRFTIPSPNVLSWALNEPKTVATAEPPTSTQNPAPTTETTPPSKGKEPKH